MKTQLNIFMIMLNCLIYPTSFPGTLVSSRHTGAREQGSAHVGERERGQKEEEPGGEVVIYHPELSGIENYNIKF